MSPVGPTLVHNDFELRVRLERRAREAFALVAGRPRPTGLPFQAAPRDETLRSVACEWAARAPCSEWIEVSLRGGEPLLLDEIPGGRSVIASPVAGSGFPGFKLTRPDPSQGSLLGGTLVEPGSADTIFLVHVLEALDVEHATALLEACWVALAPAGKLIVMGVSGSRRVRVKRQARGGRGEHQARRVVNHPNALRRQGFTVVSHEVSTASGTTCELAVGVRLGRVDGEELLLG